MHDIHSTDLSLPPRDTSETPSGRMPVSRGDFFEETDWSALLLKSDALEVGAWFTFIAVITAPIIITLGIALAYLLLVS